MVLLSLARWSVSVDRCFRAYGSFRCVTRALFRNAWVLPFLGDGTTLSISYIGRHVTVPCGKLYRVCSPSLVKSPARGV